MALFARHAEIDLDTGRQQMVWAMKDVAEAMPGLDLGDDEGIDTHMQQGLQAKATAQEAEHDDTRVDTARRKKASGTKSRRNRPRSPCATSFASSPEPAPRP